MCNLHQGTDNDDGKDKSKGGVLNGELFYLVTADSALSDEDRRLLENVNPDKVRVCDCVYVYACPRGGWVCCDDEDK